MSVLARLSHAQVLLHRILSSDHPQEQLGHVLLRCGTHDDDDPGVSVPALVLAALSPALLRPSLMDVAFDADAAVVVPDGNPERFRRFFGLLGKKAEEMWEEERACAEGGMEWFGRETEDSNKTKVGKRRKKRAAASTVEEPEDVESTVVSYSSFGRARKKTKKWKEAEEKKKQDDEDEIEAETILGTTEEEERESEEQHQGDDNSMKETDASTTEETLFERKPVGSGNLSCEFCEKKYHQVKAKNKHMLAEHEQVSLSSINGKRGCYYE